MRRLPTFAAPRRVLGLTFGACGGGGSSSSVTAPSATVAVTTESFTGTVTVGGSDSHNFTVALANGQLNATLTAAGPPSTIYMGLGLGAPSGSTCTLITGASLVTQASATAQLSGTAAAGTFCVMVYDAGNQTSDITYAVTVNHF